MTVDTLTVARKLEAAGTPRPQAEALAEVFRESEANSLADLATKADLERLELRMDARFGEVDAKLAVLQQRLVGDLGQVRSELTQLEQRMTIKLGAMIAVAVSAVAALVRLL